ncbi:phosphatidylserine decarboxylase 1 [Maudiozyma humilis]|uniref:Phosphatidylserine decarboxylase proenzyme 1, mitochondrial n=1 Tax=Maudiozyma humilis TaxID=51915 RepID=A0AAV5SA49_MAUHU|nr:phosphatidylserine decarboxylase 1 [Kazachstania humilis]
MMIPVRTALQQGGSLIKGRIAMARSISTPMHLRNRTAVLFNRRFSSHFARGRAQWARRPQLMRGAASKGGSTIVKRAKGDKAGQAADVLASRLSGKHLPMKWALITGVTIVLGTMILAQRKSDGSRRRHVVLGIDDDEVDENGKPKRRHSATYQRVKIFNDNWLFFCYSTLPLNAISRLWGQVNSLTLPMWLRPIGYNFYTHLFGVNLDEMTDPDLYHYANLSEFFYRTIRPETRPLAMGDHVVACPSDGQVLQLGVINSETGEIEQVKGLTYSVQEFLGTHNHPHMSKSESNLVALGDAAGEFAEKEKQKIQRLLKLNKSTVSLPDTKAEVVDDTAALKPALSETHTIKFKDEGDKALIDSDNDTASPSKTFKLLNQLALNIPQYRSFQTDPSKNIQLYFAVIYLSPGDYHHYHSPVDWVCKLRRHFPGDLYSVAPYFQKNMPNLFVLNERVALLGYWKYGFFSMTPVGATNVGSIRLNFDQQLVTNVKRKKNIEPHTCYEASYSNANSILGGVPLEKGEEMGGFKLGSTVVLCFEAPSNFKFDIKVGEKVKMGQKLGEVCDDDEN